MLVLLTFKNKELNKQTHRFELRPVCQTIICASLYMINYMLNADNLQSLI